MPHNQFSIWSEVYDLRDERDQQKFELTDKDIEVIERLMRGESAGIKLHKLKGTTPTVYSAYVNDTRRLLFISHDTTLALIGVLPKHNYQDLQAGFAEKFYRKAAQELGQGELATEAVDHIANFKPLEDYAYQSPSACVSYHQKFITLDNEQTGALTVSTPAVIIGDPGSGKSSICSVMIENDLNNPALLDDNGLIVYFSESAGLAEKMGPAWMLDHPLTARRPEVNQLRFLNYQQLLAEFGPRTLAGKTAVGAEACHASVAARLVNKGIQKQAPFVKNEAFQALVPTIYHEFQIITVCSDQAAYASSTQKANFPIEWRPFVYQLYQHYLGVMNQNKQYDPNLFLWTPEDQPVSRLYHDESLSASPAMNLMLRRLTRNANIVYFADPNQENTKQISDLAYIIGELGVNGKPASLVNLKKSYRLPRVVAELANELLKIKQNLNGGKNEKNQSDQITYHDPEGRDPGFLSWHGVAQVAALAARLNESNQVYVVITHEEYREEAKQHFGDQTLIFNIEEARGQEFEMVVLYRVTDPNPEASPGRGKKKSQSLLSQVNDVLVTFSPELQSKPNLAKRGKVDRRFEPYMNSLYIAVSRIAHQGYIVEAGDLANNPLHQRMVASITKSMATVQSSEALTKVTLEAVLERARQDLAEGQLIQAEAGFLKAGLSKEQFLYELDEKNRREAGLLNHIYAGRRDRALLNGKLSDADMKSLDSLIKNDDSEALKGMLAGFNQPEQLMQMPYDKNRTVLAALLAKKKLRGAVLQWMINQSGLLSAMFKSIDFGASVVVQEGKKPLKSPLILALAATEDGLNLLMKLALEGEPGLFGGLSSAVLLGELPKNIAKQILLETAIAPQSWLFLRLYEDNADTFKHTSDAFWFKALASGRSACLLTHLCHQIESMESGLQGRSMALFKSIINRIVEAPKSLHLNLFNGRAGDSVFDLMLTSGRYGSVIKSMLLKAADMFVNGYLIQEITYQSSMVARLQIILESEETKEVGEAMLAKLILNYPNKKKLDGIFRQCLPDEGRVAIKKDQLLHHIEQGQWQVSDMYDLFADDEEVAMLMEPLEMADGTKLCHLILLMQNQSACDALRSALKVVSADDADIVFKQKFTSAIQSMTISHEVIIRDHEGKLRTVPTWHYLVDHYSEMFISGIKAADFSGEMAVEAGSKLTTPYYGSRSGIEINLLTLCAINSVEFMLNMLTVYPGCVQWITWNTIYPHPDGYLLNVIASHASCEMEDPRAEEKYVKQRRQVVKHLKSLPVNFDSYLDAALLFQEGKVGVAGRTIFDAFLVSDVGVELLSLYNLALIASPEFLEYFNDTFLNEKLEGSRHLEETGVASKKAVSRFELMAFQPAIEPLFQHFMRNVKDVTSWMRLITEVSDSNMNRIEDYQWSNFANLISSEAHHETLRMLIKERPEALKGLPSSVWHAPVQAGNDKHLPLDNYLLLKLIIRVHGKDFIGEFFKANYEEDYNKAEQLAEVVILSAQERRRANKAQLAKILAIPMIKNHSDTLLKLILNDESQFPNLMAVYKKKTVVDHIMCSDKLRSVFMETLNDWVNSQSVDKIKALLSAIDMNALTLVDGAIVRPLWHHVLDMPFWHNFLKLLYEHDPEFLVRSMNINTLVHPFKDRSSTENTANPLVLLLILNLPYFAFAFLRYSESRDEVLNTAISHPDCPPVFRGHGLIQSYANQMVMNLDQNDQYDQAIYIIVLLLESASTVFNLKKQDIPIIFGSLTQDTTFYTAIKQKVKPAIVSMFISAIREINIDYANKLVKRYGFSVEGFDKENHKRGREICKHGLTSLQAQNYQIMVDERDILKFEMLLKDKLRCLLFTQRLSDGRPLFVHLYEVEAFRARLIEIVNTVVSDAYVGRADYFDLMLLLSPWITMAKMNRGGHEMPVFFDMIQDPDVINLTSKMSFPLECLVKPYYSHHFQANGSALFILMAYHFSIFKEIYGIDHPSYQSLIKHPELLNVYSIKGENLSALGVLLSSLNVYPKEKLRLIEDIILRPDFDALEANGYTALFEQKLSFSSHPDRKVSHLDLLTSYGNYRSIYLSFVKANVLPIEPLIMMTTQKNIPRLVLFIDDLEFLTHLKFTSGDLSWNRWDRQEVLETLYRTLTTMKLNGLSVLESLLSTDIGKQKLLELLKLYPECFDYFLPPDHNVNHLVQLGLMVGAYIVTLHSYDEFKSIAGRNPKAALEISNFEARHNVILDELINNHLAENEAGLKLVTESNERIAWTRFFNRADCFVTLRKVTQTQQALLSRLKSRPLFLKMFTQYIESMTQEEAESLIVIMIVTCGLEDVLDILLLNQPLYPIAKSVIDKRLNNFMTLCSLNQGGQSYLFKPLQSLVGEETTRAKILMSEGSFHFYLMVLLKRGAVSVVDFSSLLNREYRAAVQNGNGLTWHSMLQSTPAGRQIIQWVVSQPELVDRLDEPLLHVLKQVTPSAVTPVARLGFFQQEAARVEAQPCEVVVKPKK